MKSLRLKIVGTVVAVSLALCALMWLFHAYYFLRDPGYLSENVLAFWAAVLALIALMALILFIWTGFLDRVFRRLHRGEPCSDRETRKARRTMRSIPVLVVVTNVIGFVLGPIISTIMAAVLSGSPVVPILLILTIAYNIPIGIISAILSIYLINGILLQPRLLLGIHHVSDAEKGLGFRAKNLLVSLGSVLFALSLFLAAGYGFYQEKTSLPLAVAGAAEIGSPSPAAEEARQLLAAAANPTQEGIALLTAYRHRENRKFLWQMAVLGIIVIGILALTNAAVINEQRTQLRFLIRSIEQVGGGGGDLSKRLPIVRNDEFGNLTHGINQFMNGLEDLLRNLQRTAKQVGSS